MFISISCIKLSHIYAKYSYLMQRMLLFAHVDIAQVESVRGLLIKNKNILSLLQVYRIAVDLFMAHSCLKH